MNGFEDSFRVRKVGGKKEEHAGIFRSAERENFFTLNCEILANYLKKLSLQKEKIQEKNQDTVVISTHQSCLLIVNKIQNL